MRKRKMFKKSLLIYASILGVLVIVFLIHVFKVMKDYEYNQTGNFLKSSITSISDSDLKGYLKDNNIDEKMLSELKNMINSDKLEFKKGEDEKFEVSYNNRQLFSVETKVTGDVTRLGLFTYQTREVTDIKPTLERGLYYYDFEIPSNFEIFLDGKKYEGVATETKEYKGLSFMYAKEGMPKMATYKIDNLDSETM